MTKKIDAADVLAIPMGRNDADAATVRDYFKKLLWQIWEDGESFSGKRPFGNSGWEYDLYGPLIKAGAVKGVIEVDGEDENIASVDEIGAGKVIRAAIGAL